MMDKLPIKNLKAIKKRFWKKVGIAGDNDCWNWTGAKTKWGYGRFLVNKVRVVAHRFSWMLQNGDIPDGLLVCHKCDKPSCVNPAHLFLGTDADNSADMLSKGRFPVGESHWFAKLNESKVREIRRRSNNGDNQPSIARAFGISRSVVSGIITLRAWSHVK